jgi:hypothetical protein
VDLTRPAAGNQSLVPAIADAFDATPKFFRVVVVEFGI